MTSLGEDNLVAFYCLSASEILPPLLQWKGATYKS